MGSWRAALAQPRLPFHVIQLPGYMCVAGVAPAAFCHLPA
jgi:hypothetical protein